jgi:hypothetical protein
MEMVDNIKNYKEYNVNISDIYVDGIWCADNLFINKKAFL